MQPGVWVMSQDENTLVYVKTFEVWQDGRVIARLGKDWKLLGVYKSYEFAQGVIAGIGDFITSTKNEVFKMPKQKPIKGEITNE